VAHLARRLVRRPETVSVEEHRSEGAVALVLRVDPVDLKVVIGRRGQTIRAMRALLAAAGARHRRRFRLEVQE
jgi:predicted RNA-binding protein YlqC (UPF0109 family)